MYRATYLVYTNGKNLPRFFIWDFDTFSGKGLMIIAPFYFVFGMGKHLGRLELLVHINQVLHLHNLSWYRDKILSIERAAPKS